jgi:hypothetical protein
MRKKVNRKLIINIFILVSIATLLAFILYPFLKSIVEKQVRKDEIIIAPSK